MLSTVWVFCAPDKPIPSAVFSAEQPARDWIRTHRLMGLFTEYPIDTPIYEGAVESGHFKPKYSSQKSSAFIARFSSGHWKHYHFEDGVDCEDETLER
jgi:hypothetical protein